MTLADLPIVLALIAQNGIAENGENGAHGAAEGAQRAMMLLLMFALLGIVLVTTVAVLFALRRDSRRKTPDADPGPSAWEEAGRRAQPLPPDAEEDRHPADLPPPPEPGGNGPPPPRP